MKWRESRPGELPSVLKMLDQRLRAPLDQDVNGIDAGVDQIGQYEIDDAVFAAERNRRFCAIASQRIETGSLTTRHHKRKSPHCIPFAAEEKPAAAIRKPI